MKASCLLLPLFCTAGCWPDGAPQGEIPRLHLRPVLNIVVNDLSRSASWLQLDTAELTTLLVRDSASRPAVELAGITITANSRVEQPYISPVLRCASGARGGNFYRQRQIEMQNSYARADYARAVGAVVDSFVRRVVRPRTHAYSDVAGALEITRVLAAQPSYAGYDIRLIIFSDLRQDVPGTAALLPVRFSPNIAIYVVGKSPAIDLQRLFPTSRPVELAVFRAQFIHE